MLKRYFKKLTGIIVNFCTKMWRDTWIKESRHYCSVH